MTDGLSDSLRWALALGTEPERAMVDWMAVELVPGAQNAVDAITRPAGDDEADRRRLDLLKSGFKSLRVGAESSSDRRLAARCYAATIAAGIVRHGCWITTQRPEKAIAAIQDLESDDEIGAPLRDVAAAALARIANEVIEGAPIPDGR